MLAIFLIYFCYLFIYIISEDVSDFLVYCFLNEKDQSPSYPAW